uniref:Uncharacterized protein n=2 Tax=Rhizochromulina marina TaxID=1034831 RepID=A0A7S2WEV5_9STRA|mmetsp:Transcript_22191/g.64423  ORF Transcript_22191/g.64423 Transcript_22191/m.64423 type:complete len:970 (+) Transcript_22191:108-3017(+)|eukprot:CAMPEP_0118966468 /NCGR_PEP_ID=MMETSP1173-20130426/3937_1 /TAXON_ID=1034831 /ORGANISM="Rhizochromulina marina cf, Strain CCMP1243" /LENGTH=969 /DNA_ID=CAMNT_0006915259 /DNA_START=76 /DNA_END=2985 /DNA_ORIENTATION=-
MMAVGGSPPRAVGLRGVCDLPGRPLLPPRGAFSVSVDPNGFSPELLVVPENAVVRWERSRSLPPQDMMLEALTSGLTSCRVLNAWKESSGAAGCCTHSFPTVGNYEVFLASRPSVRGRVEVVPETDPRARAAKKRLQAAPVGAVRKSPPHGEDFSRSCVSAQAGDEVKESRDIADLPAPAPDEEAEPGSAADVEDEGSDCGPHPVTHTVRVEDFVCHPMELAARTGDHIEFLWSVKDAAFSGLDFQFALRVGSEEIDRSSELGSSTQQRTWTSSPLLTPGQVEFVELIHGAKSMRGLISVAARPARDPSSSKKNRKNKNKRRKKRARKRKSKLNLEENEGASLAELSDAAMPEPMSALQKNAADSANSATYRFVGSEHVSDTLHRVVVKLHGFEPSCLDLVIGDSVEWICEEACGGVRLRCDEFDLESPTLHAGDIWRCSFDEKTTGLELERSSSVEVHMENLVFPRRCKVLITSRSAYESTSSSFYDSDDNFSERSSLSGDGEIRLPVEGATTHQQGLPVSHSSPAFPLPTSKGPRHMPPATHTSPSLLGSFGLRGSLSSLSRKDGSVLVGNCGPSMQDLISGAVKLPTTADEASLTRGPSGPGTAHSEALSDAETESSSFDSDSVQPDHLSSGSETEEKGSDTAVRKSATDPLEQEAAVASPREAPGPAPSVETLPLRGSFWPGAEGSAPLSDTSPLNGELSDAPQLTEEQDHENSQDEWLESRSSSRRRRRRQAAQSKVKDMKAMLENEQIEAAPVSQDLEPPVGEIPQELARASVPEEDQAPIDSGEALFAFLKSHPLSKDTAPQGGSTTSDVLSPQVQTPDEDTPAQPHTIMPSVLSQAPASTSKRERYVQRFFTARFENVSKCLTSMIDTYPGGSRAPVLVIEADGTRRGHPEALQCLGSTNDAGKDSNASGASGSVERPHRAEISTVVGRATKLRGAGAASSTKARPPQQQQQRRRRKGNAR